MAQTDKKGGAKKNSSAVTGKMTGKSKEMQMVKFTKDTKNHKKDQVIKVHKVQAAKLRDAGKVDILGRANTEEE